MRLYAESDLEALRARAYLKDWRDEDLLSQEQYDRLEPEATCELRTTNVFLRLVLLFFTLFAVAAAVALFFVMFGIRSAGSAAGLCLLVFAAISYLGAEVAAGQYQLYRYGIEEALVIGSVALFCAGLDFLVFTDTHASTGHGESLLISITGLVLSLWIWRRFGLWYAFPAAMIFAVLAPEYWVQSPAAQRCLICVFYLLGVMCVAAFRSRHRLDDLERAYPLAEAFLCLGIYCVLNLKLTGMRSLVELWSSTRGTAAFPAPFYWTTWVLIWCLPPLILARGVRRKDRFVLAVGIITTVLTFVTNKPYLGWQRHTWDPMLLGVAFIAVAVFLFRWLARGPEGVRHAFTAASMSAKHKRAFSLATAAFSLRPQHNFAPAAQPKSQEFDSGFGGGSGGGGASGDF